MDGIAKLNLKFPLIRDEVALSGENIRFKSVGSRRRWEKFMANEAHDYLSFS